MLSNTLNETLMTWLTEFHFPNANPPKIWRRVEEPVDEKAEAEKDQIIYNLGFEPEEDFIKEKYGRGWVKRDSAFKSHDSAIWGGAGADAPDQHPEGFPQSQQSAPVQDTALNGAQVSSLVQVIESIGSGIIPKETGIHLILAAFPAMSPETVRAMVNPIEVRKPEQQPEAVPEAQPKPEDTEPSEFSEGSGFWKPLKRLMRKLKSVPGLAADYSEIDEMTDQLEAEAEKKGVMDGMLEPVRRLVRNAKSLEEIREGLLEIYPDMDSDAFAETLNKAMVAAFNRGKAGMKK
jgi:hypothetical protein